jgi:uncharacterized protein (TIGR02246 family)
MSDEDHIRQLIERWAAAVRARDINGVLAHHASDIVMFDVPLPAESRGLDAYRQTWDQFFGWARDLGVFDIDRLEITAGSDVAFAVARMRCAGMEDTGYRSDLDFRLTIGLRKIDGEWIVTHEHHSVPSD